MDSKQHLENEPVVNADKAMDHALQKAVLLIGGMAVSRAINDDELAERLLKACQSELLGY